MFQCPAVHVLNFILTNGGELNFGISGVICDIFRSLLVITKLFKPRSYHNQYIGTNFLPISQFSWALHCNTASCGIGHLTKSGKK